MVCTPLLSIPSTKRYHPIHVLLHGPFQSSGIVCVLGRYRMESMRPIARLRTERPRHIKHACTVDHYPSLQPCVRSRNVLHDGHGHAFRWHTPDLPFLLLPLGPIQREASERARDLEARACMYQCRSWRDRPWMSARYHGGRGPLSFAHARATT